MTTPRLLIIALMIGLFAFCTGCDDAEDALNNIPTPGDDPAVQLVAAEGVQMAAGLMATLPDLAEADFTSKSIEDAYFDESCTCWYWTVAEGNENSNPYWLRQASYQATFLNGETPQRELEGADRIALAIIFQYEWSDFQGEAYSSKTVMITQDLEITGLGEASVSYGMNGLKVGPLNVEGTGMGYVSGGTGNYSDDEWDGFYEEFDVNAGITMPLPGCPSGFLNFDTEEAQFNMGFNGTSTGSWAYKFGSTTVDSGNFPIQCATK